jgi:hypothetical protein
MLKSGPQLSDIRLGCGLETIRHRDNNQELNRSHEDDEMSFRQETSLVGHLLYLL